MVALLFATVALQTIVQASSLVLRQATVPADCLASSNFVAELVTCLDTFTVQTNYYTPETHAAAQPDEAQRSGWSSLIGDLLEIDGDCASPTIPDSLKEFYTIQEFKNDFCVLYEHSSTKGTYEKGWGTMIVPRSKSAVLRNVHFSAPHPGWELNTIEQAADLFEYTQSKSFLVPGRNQNASTELSACIIGNGNYKTDAAINIEEPFFDANVAIREWQKDKGGCPAESCAFIQFRGKSAKSCPSDVIFLSPGFNSTDSTGLPVELLQNALEVAFPEWAAGITLPSDSKCFLLGTENVVGRYLNGVPAADVCGTPATKATGEYVQAFESIQARDPKVYPQWSDAVNAAFPAKK